MPKIGFTFALFVSLIATSVFVLTFGFALRGDEIGRGTFGDAFGVATSFFSLLTLGFLIAAVVIQRQELEIIKAERDDTREILKEQKGQTAQQIEALVRQSAEAAQQSNSLQRQADESIKQSDILVTQAEEQTFFSILSLTSQEVANLQSAPSELLKEKSLLESAAYFCEEAVSEWHRAEAHDFKKSEARHIAQTSADVQEAFRPIKLIHTAYDLYLGGLTLRKPEWNRERRRYLWAMRALATPRIYKVWAYYALLHSEEDPSLGWSFISITKPKPFDPETNRWLINKLNETAENPVEEMI